MPARSKAHGNRVLEPTFPISVQVKKTGLLGRGKAEPVLTLGDGVPVGSGAPVLGADDHVFPAAARVALVVPSLPNVGA